MYKRQALLLSIGVVVGTIWTLTQVFDGLPVDGGAPTLVEIPDLTGSEQAQALEDLQSLGFKVGIVNAADSSVPAGSVIRTQPPSNTIINPDSLVTIIVSVGPEAFPIPYVLDIEAERAIYVVEESGFILGQLLEVNDNNIPRGFVISQNPVAGTKMSPGSSVDLVVSKGPSLVEISDLSRKSPEDAIQILQFDCTMFGGFTNGKKLSALCEINHIDIAPHHDCYIHAPLVASSPSGRIVETFHDERDTLQA